MTGLTTRRTRHIGQLAAAAFVVGLVVFLPAKMFEARINQGLTPPWHLSVSGTVWRGAGTLQSGPAPDSIRVPLAWRFDPPALARLRVGWRIVAASPPLSGAVRIGAGLQSVEFREAALAVDAAVISQLMPGAAMFAPSGNFLLSTPDDAALTIGYGNDLHATGAGRVEAQGFGLRSFGAAPLGNYQLNFTARDTAIDYVIAQSSGALTLDGGGSIQTAAPRQIAYAGNITPSPALPDSVLSQLKAIGRPAADGRLRVDWQARW